MIYIAYFTNAAKKTRILHRTFSFRNEMPMACEKVIHYVWVLIKVELSKWNTTLYYSADAHQKNAVVLHPRKLLRHSGITRLMIKILNTQSLCKPRFLHFTFRILTVYIFYIIILPFDEFTGRLSNRLDIHSGHFWTKHYLIHFRPKILPFLAMPTIGNRWLIQCDVENANLPYSNIQ